MVREGEPLLFYRGRYRNIGEELPTTAGGEQDNPADASADRMVRDRKR